MTLDLLINININLKMVIVAAVIKSNILVSAIHFVFDLKNTSDCLNVLNRQP